MTTTHLVMPDSASPQIVYVTMQGYQADFFCKCLEAGIEPIITLAYYDMDNTNWIGYYLESTEYANDLYYEGGLKQCVELVQLIFDISGMDAKDLAKVIRERLADPYCSDEAEQAPCDPFDGDPPSDTDYLEYTFEFSYKK